MNKETQATHDFIKTHAAEIIARIKTLPQGQQADAWEVARELFDTELDLCINCHKMDCNGRWCRSLSG